MRCVRLVSGLVFVLGLAGCGSSTTPAPVPTVQGHWQGTITSPADGTGTITMDLNQSGSVVTGTVLLSQPGLPDERGTLNGTVDMASDGVTLRYTTFYDYGDGCTGTYGGALDMTGDVLSGSYAGQNCAHTFTGSLRAEKSQTPLP